ncbi:MAG: hypothetical protein ACRDDY_13915 [Clostridium sp.]|uniref:hypothetical protein n=1 Tax=Clostridium sp. TaxID=1506 RepID=UPI003EE6AB6F
MLDFDDALKLSHEQIVKEYDAFDFHELCFKGDTFKVLGCDLHTYSIFWDVYRENPDIPHAKHFLLNYNELFTDKIMQKIFYKIIEPTKYSSKYNKKKIWKSCYRAYNRIYNYAAMELMPYIDSIDSFAIMQLLNDPEIRDANQRVQEKLADVEYGYGVFKRRLIHKDHEDNPISRAFKYGTAPLPQLNQSFVAIGQVTDIDSVVYLNEIRRGFAMGYVDANSMVKASRSAAKALLFNKSPVADAEYFNRRLQLVGNYITTVAQHHDCGTTDAHDVTLPETENYFRLWHGITLVLPDGKTRPINPDDKDLMGKRVKVRTTLCCRMLHKQTVCSTCYGDIAYSLVDRIDKDAPTARPEDLNITSNPGHVSTTEICGPATQKVISTKHSDFIRCVINIVLPAEDRSYMEMHRSLDSIKFKERLSDLKVKLRLHADEVKNLISLLYMDDLRKLQLGHFSSLSTCDIITYDNDGYVTNSRQANLSRQATNPSLSASMLKYVAKRNWETQGKYILIDLDEWDYTKPVFTYQLKHENMAAFVDRLELFIRSTSNDEDTKGKRSHMMRLTRFNDPTEALIAAFMLTADKLGVNVMHLATVLAATRVMDPENGDWRIANGLGVGRFAAHDDIITNRDIAGAFLYQGQFDTLTDPASYLYADRVRSPLKPLIMP